MEKWGGAHARAPRFEAAKQAGHLSLAQCGPPPKKTPKTVGGGRGSSSHRGGAARRYVVDPLHRLVDQVGLEESGGQGERTAHVRVASVDVEVVD